MVGRCVLMLFVVALAGCADEASSPNAGAEAPDDEGLAARQWVSFAEEGSELSESFSGRFEFTDNDQFAGEGQRRLGMDPANQHVHDASGVVPADGLYEMVVTATAQASGGDIDVGIRGDAVLSTLCDCPFGGENTVYVYGLPGDVEILIQYDEISSGPNDPNVAAQGVPYEIQVTARPLPERVPQGVPLAVELEHNQSLVLDGHSSTVTVHDGDDQVVAIMEPGNTTFVAAQAGEYVLIARQDGTPFGLELPSDAEIRILDVEGEMDSQTFASGQAAEATFDAGAGFIEMFACGISGDVTVDPAFTVTDPAGELWSSSSSAGPVPLGWGSCTGTWRGHPELMQGEWTLAMEETAGPGIELLWFTGHYVR
ncbi:MAG: hypothetical protein ACPHID_05015 [Thermoplasmatota archaeon]